LHVLAEARPGDASAPAAVFAIAFAAVFSFAFTAVFAFAAVFAFTFAFAVSAPLTSLTHFPRLLPLGVVQFL
jgi:hypothetical protein